MSVTGEPTREPLAGGGPWDSYLVGATGAISAQAALFAARRTGRGRTVDIGALEALAAAHQWSIVIYTHQGYVKRRWGNLHGEAHHPLSLYRCADGWVCVGAVSAQQWEGMCIAADRAELLADDALYAPAARFDRAPELDEALAPWFASLPAQEAVRRLQESRCPAGRVLTLHETLRDPQLEARAWWVTAEQLGIGAKMPGAPFRLNGAEPPYRPAPALGETAAANR